MSVTDVGPIVGFAYDNVAPSATDVRQNDPLPGFRGTFVANVPCISNSLNDEQEELVGKWIEGKSRTEDRCRLRVRFLVRNLAIL